MKGTGKVYICIFDGKGCARGERASEDNKRITGTTDYDNKTDAFSMRTSKFHDGTSKHHLKTSKHHLQTSAHAMATTKKGAARLKLDHVSGLRM